MEELIETTLEQCAKDGFSASAIEAALNTTEFHLRENNTGRFPRGLSLMLRAMGNWIYDKDPYEALHWTEPLNAFKVCHRHNLTVLGLPSWSCRASPWHCCTVLITLV